MSTANLLKHLSFNNLGQHRSIFPFQWLARNAGVRCFSHNTADASGFPVRYISKKQSPTHISLQQDIPSTPASTLFPHKSFQALRVDTTDENRLKNTGPILNLWDGHGTDLTDKDSVKLHNQAVVDCINIGQVVAYKSAALREGIKLNQELSSDELVDKELTDKELVKLHKQAVESVDCMNTGQVVAHNSITYKSSGLREGIKLNQELSSDELSCDDLVDEECMEASEEVFEDVQSNYTYFKAKPDKTRQGAEKLALQLLARRAFSVVELRKKLCAKLFPHNIVEAVLRDFQDRGMINDGLYAETFSHSRWQSSSWGPGRIKQALSQKGVNKPAVEKAVKLVFEDSEEEEESSGVRLSSDSLQKLYIQASKQWQRSHNVTPETRKTRVIRWLQYRGFDWGVIGSIVKKLESKSCSNPARSRELPPR